MDFNLLNKVVEEAKIVFSKGTITEIIGLIVKANGPSASIGELCYINNGKKSIPAEVVGFREGKTLLMPLGNLEGISPGNIVTATGKTLTVQVGDHLIGRVLDGLGEFIDTQKLSIASTFKEYPLDAPPPHPLKRRRIKESLITGVKAIDGLITCGKGQRLGIFAGSGVGKSTLLGMIARNSSADVNVIALIGERGREVREFLEKDLGPQGLARSIVIVASSDQPALVRIKGASTATAIAEYFRDQGLSVMLMMDSVTRFAMAQREVGLAVGEPPTTRGYTPSVFALLPRLLERSGTGETGEITALFTVLVDGDDMNEPIADAVRGILDGHIVLSRKLAALNHYPAIDILQSVSRLMLEISGKDHQRAAQKLRELLAIYNEAKDLIDIGAYKAGSNEKIDKAIHAVEKINYFLRQNVDEAYDGSESINSLIDLMSSY